MHPFGDVATQRQRLGTALRGLRREAGLSQEQLAERLGTSQSKISRLERGEQSASASLVEHWAAACEAPEEVREELAEQAERVAVQAVAWRETMRRQGLPQLQADTGEIEQSAGTIRKFSALLIPGLLQVPQYARAVFAAGHPDGGVDIDGAVAGRMNRQGTLYSESTQCDFVIAEAALRWEVGSPQVMRAQLDRIAMVMDLEAVSVGLLPLRGRGGVWHEHSFSLYDDRAETLGPIVHVETLTRAVNITDPEEVDRYRETLARLREAAIFGEEAKRLLARVRADLDEPQETT